MAWWCNVFCFAFFLPSYLPGGMSFCIRGSELTESDLKSLTINASVSHQQLMQSSYPLVIFLLCRLPSTFSNTVIFFLQKSKSYSSSNLYGSEGIFAVSQLDRNLIQSRKTLLCATNQPFTGLHQ